MTASILLIPPISCRMCWCRSCRHSRCNAAFNWRKFCPEGLTACTRRSSISQTCSIRFKFWLMLDFPVCQVQQDIHPQIITEPPTKGTVGWMFLEVYTIFSVCKLSFVHRLHEAESGSRSTNIYYAMSLYSNYVALNIMLTVIVEVDLIAWDVQLLSLTSFLLISNGFSLFLLTYLYLVIIEFSEQVWLWMASVWPSDKVPCIHGATLHVVFRNLPNLSRCWFSHKPADYCIMIAHLTSNSFEGNSCRQQADYLTCVRLRYLPAYLRRPRNNTLFKPMNISTQIWIVDKLNFV